MWEFFLLLVKEVCAFFLLVLQARGEGFFLLLRSSSRPDMTFAVDWASRINDLSIYCWCEKQSDQEESAREVEA